MQLITFPLLPAAALVLFNLVQMGQTSANVVKTIDMESTIKQAADIMEISNALYAEADAVSLYVGE